MRIPSGRTKLCHAIDKSSHLLGYLGDRSDGTPPWYRAQIVSRLAGAISSRLVKQFVLGLIQTDRASLDLFFFSGLQGVVDVCLGRGSHYCVFIKLVPS
jgi:hypothetical protein